MNRIKTYLQGHETVYQYVLFMFFATVIMVVQLLSRLIFDLLLQGLDSTIIIWPFEKQAVGSFLAFLFSNIIAKVGSYMINRKKTFDANNNLTLSIIIYTILMISLIIIETIIGTPIQNNLYKIFGGTFSGAELTTSTVINQKLYQLCGTLSPMIYGTFDGLIVFFADKYLIMTKAKNKDEIKS